MTKTIEISNLSVVLNRNTILENINFEAYSGEIIGIIGRNGSGKSVLFKTIAGFYPPKKGKVIINSTDIYNEKTFPKNLGALIENPGFLPNKTGFQNLEFLANIQRKITKDEIIETLSKLGLSNALNTRVKHYSLGMRQRLGIAQAIMEKPSVILLDEPTNGLDKEGTEYVIKLLKELREQGVSILITSHLIQDIHEITNKVYNIEEGKFIRND